MGSLPPSKAREFEERIMVSRGGIEYMAGGTEFPSNDWTTSLGRQKQKQEQNQNRWGRGTSRAKPTPRPDAVVCLTTPISSYMVHAFCRRCNQSFLRRTLPNSTRTALLSY